jgi:SRSO17 transposase
MMNFLTPTPDPMFEIKFDNIFSEPSQRENFRLYGTGLILEIKRKNIWYISEHILEIDYQSMHHFMHDAPWVENRLNDQRVAMMNSNRSTRSCYDGYVIIDDTGNPKSGDFTHATRKQWIGSLGKVDTGQVVVTSHYVDSRKDWPIDHRPYLPQKWVEEQNVSFELNDNRGKELYAFKSKLELGLELIDDIKERGIRFSHLLIDAWYDNSPGFIKEVESRECLYITSLYANRHVYFRLPGEESIGEHSVKELVTSLEDGVF